MCFSATASFSAAVVLIPVGAYCIKKVAPLNKKYRLIVLLPLIFGIQQLFEGFVWLAIEPGGGGATRLPALGFMFFSHLFWLFWIPLACYVVESNTLKRKVMFTFFLLGAVHGLIMYVPLWFNSDWLVVELVQKSISYKATLLYDDYIPRIAVRVLYAVLVIASLLLSSDRYLRVFGVIIAMSVVISTVYFGHAFISIWCYFAAVLSLYVLFMIIRITKTTHEDA